MAQNRDIDDAKIQSLAARRKQMYSLSGEWYWDANIYQADLQRIWSRHWLFGGHTCEIPHPGDYMTVVVGRESILVVRDDNGDIHAFHNLCRHRGTILCDEDRGHVGRFVCPYHQWAYDRNGDLLACRGMHAIDKSTLGLVPVQVRAVEGFLFVCLADSPPDFSGAAQALGPAMRPQGLERAKVARAVDYVVHANWKLIWENNRECYHCNLNHPQYIRANYDHYNRDDVTESIQSRMDAAIEHSQQKWTEQGLVVSHQATGMAQFPDVDGKLWFSANRTAMAEGYVSETMDGRQVAPLMGAYTEADVGTLRIRAVPNMWNHSSCDHSVTTRLLPSAPDRTLLRVYWLVHEDAREGVDYDLEQLMPFWQLTSEQDWALCERAQRGVGSSAYQPGPYSTFKEYNVEAFVQWYLKQIESV